MALRGVSSPNVTMASISGLQGALDNKNPMIVSGAHINPASTGASTSLATNLNTVTTVLGVLTAQVNTTNAAQNDLATKYNDLAAKFNTLLTHLEAQGIQSP